MDYKNYELLSVNKILFQKYFLLKREDKIKIKNISLMFSSNSLQTDEDKSILNYLQNIESITGQKAILSTKKYVYIGSKKQFVCTVLLVLRKKKLYNFLKYFSAIAQPLYNKQYGEFFLGKTFGLMVKDFTIFYNSKQSLNDSKGLNIQFQFTKKIDNKLGRDFLNLFSLHIYN